MRVSHFLVVNFYDVPVPWVVEILSGAQPRQVHRLRRYFSTAVGCFDNIKYLGAKGRVRVLALKIEYLLVKRKRKIKSGTQP